jgi:hypothetical protein
MPPLEPHPIAVLALMLASYSLLLPRFFPL